MNTNICSKCGKQYFGTYMTDSSFTCPVCHPTITLGSVSDMKYIPPEPYYPTRRDYFAAAALNGLFSIHFNFTGSYEENAVKIADKIIELLDSSSSSKDGK